MGLHEKDWEKVADTFFDGNPQSKKANTFVSIEGTLKHIVGRLHLINM
jgi:hypothetical protein